MGARKRARDAGGSCEEERECVHPGQTGALHGSGRQQLVMGGFHANRQQQRLESSQHSQIRPGGGVMGGATGGHGGGGKYGKTTGGGGEGEAANGNAGGTDGGKGGKGGGDV